ncbi:MAG: hypothetical protein GC203_19555 [Phenylobacterium sp.]|uniref:hypothetical protein n=1 Tax=Phenylobacterium sp. TaxID=1871053 RepID=UPI0026005C63|nr:hypothetical protein [Phenylobacterium sp.]MBI1200061.1 hypothetical protein [Phenylobacterium sp.]
MTARTPADEARDDLAFLRGLVTGGDNNFQRQLGEGYAVGGACYGTQMALHMLQAWAGWFTAPAAAMLVGLGPTLVFLALLSWLLWRRRGAPPNTANRAIGAAFQAAGLANLALAAVVGGAAWRAQSFQIWLIFPCAVFVLQGAAWLVAWHVRRRRWFGAIAGGWFATGIAMGFAIDVVPAYMALAAFGFIAFMLVPGLALLRDGRTA